MFPTWMALATATSRPSAHAASTAARTATPSAARSATASRPNRRPAPRNAGRGFARTPRDSPNRRPRRRGIRRDRRGRCGRRAVRCRARPLGLHRGRDGSARVGAGRAHTPRAVHRRDTPVLHPSRPQGPPRRDQAAISSSTRRPASASRTWCLTRSGSRSGRFTSTRTTICCGWAGWIRSRARDRNRAPGHPARARGAGATRAGGLLPQRDRAAPRRRHGAVRRRGGRHAPKGSCSRARRRS
jgi:hypothetical protein